MLTHSTLQPHPVSHKGANGSPGASALVLGSVTMENLFPTEQDSGEGTQLGPVLPLRQSPGLEVLRGSPTSDESKNGKAGGSDRLKQEQGHLRGASARAPLLTPSQFLKVSSREGWGGVLGQPDPTQMGEMPQHSTSLQKTP